MARDKYMFGFEIGTLLVISAIPIGLLLFWFLHPSRQTISIATFVIAVTGFCLQMYSAFSMRRDYNKIMNFAKMLHEQRLEKAKGLPPAEAAKLLLGDPFIDEKG